MAAGLKGILPVLPTPFLADGGVDEAGMSRLVQFALDQGVDGVVFPGFASEVENLDADERALLLRIVVAAAAGRVPVVAGASAADWREVVDHGRVATGLGIRHLMVQPPKSVGIDAPALIEFLGNILEALPDVEIILQNAPAPRGSDLSPQAIVEILARSATCCSSNRRCSARPSSTPWQRRWARPRAGWTARSRSRAARPGCGPPSSASAARLRTRCAPGVRT